jgi:uncharacterized protein (TIGR02271 family)
MILGGNKVANQRETVVGVFMDDSYAQRAMQELQAAGFKPNIADENALRNMPGVKQEEAEVYLGRYNEGNKVLTVSAGNRGEDALNIMLGAGAEYMNLHGGGSSGAGAQARAQTQTTTQTQGYDANYYRNLKANERQYGRYDQNLGRAQTADELRIQLREEELHATKQAVQAGEVEIRKTVHEEQRQIPVDLRHEEVYVERRQVDQPISGEITDAQDEVIRIPVYEEQVQVTKQGRIAEEVVIGKNVEQERQVVSGTVRREDVEVVNTEGLEVRGDAQTRGDVDANATTGTSQGGVRPYDTDR